MHTTDNMADDRRLMTIVEVADRLRISLRTAYAWAKDGTLPAFKVGQAWRFDRADMDRWIDAQKKAE